MLARVLALLPLAVLATASHLDARNSCSSGAVNCCNSYQGTYKDSSEWLKHNGFGQLIGLDLDALAPVYAGCTPISVIAVSGHSCSSQATCCEGNSYNGLVNIGCTPINVNL